MLIPYMLAKIQNWSQGCFVGFLKSHCDKLLETTDTHPIIKRTKADSCAFHELPLLKLKYVIMFATVTSSSVTTGKIYKENRRKENKIGL